MTDPYGPLPGTGPSGPPPGTARSIEGDATRDAADASAIEIRARRRLGGFRLDVDFQVPGGTITALFGRSGSGKTSLIDTVAGILRPDAGRIRVGGQVLFDSEARVDVPIERRGLGYVFQDARLFPHLTVRGNLRYGLARSRGARQLASFDAIVELLGLGPLLERRPHRLSGGERQRVAIGRALLAQPSLLLLDEPLAALDGARKNEILPYLERLRDEYRIAALYVTHSVEEVIRLASHVVLLSDGRQAAVGPVAQVLSRMDLTPLAGRFEAGVVLDCVVVEHDAAYALSTLAFDGGRLRVPRLDLAPGRTLRVRIRARDVSVALAPHADLSIANRLAGRVWRVRATDDGPYAEVEIALGRAGRLRALVTRESVDRLALAAGMPVWAMVKSVAVDSRSVGYVRVPSASR